MRKSKKLRKNLKEEKGPRLQNMQMMEGSERTQEVRNDAATSDGMPPNPIEYTARLS